MFLGHYGVGLASKKVEPQASLGTYIMAAVFLDLLWPVFLLLGLEHVKIDPGNTVVTPLNFYDYPLSHSLLMSIVWSLLFGGIYYLIKKNRKTSIVLGLCVFSHWILDFIVHRTDLPLAPGVGIFFGLGLWNSLPATLIVELFIFLGGAYLYLKTTKAKDKIGIYSLVGFIVLLLLIYAMNLFSGTLPPNVNALAFSALGQWLFVAWGYWIDKHRLIKDRK
jgi:multisubunit Na+/H+ antiporter MnhC subunit